MCRVFFVVFTYYPLDVCRVCGDNPVTLIISMILIFFYLLVLLEACNFTGVFLFVLFWCFFEELALFH